MLPFLIICITFRCSESKREIVGDTSSGGGSTINYSTVSTVTIGRTSLTVKVDSSTTHTADNKFIDRASASIAMKYKVTQNEYLFIAEMDLKSVEKSLYILDAMIANKGKATKEILNDKTLSVKGVEMLFDINYGKGLSMWQVEKLYQQEVLSPKRAEAWGLLGIRALSGGGGFSLERKSSTPSKVEVPSAKKPSTPTIEAAEIEGTGEFDNGWDMPRGGGEIGGRRYSEHSLERMAPDTIQVRAELEKRALEKGIKPGTKEFKDFVDPRGIPPMVVEDTIKNVKLVAGNRPNTLKYDGEDVTVITNTNGDVITVIPK